MKVSMGGSGSLKGDDDVKVVGKVITTQLHTSLLKVSSTATSTTTTTTRPITKRIMIGFGAGCSSSSKPPSSNEELKNKGKCVFTEPTAEEKKAAIEA